MRFRAIDWPRAWRRLLILAGMLALSVAQSAADEQDAFEAGAAQNYFYIEPSYDGTTIVLFGSIEREIVKGLPFDVAVTIHGPVKPVTIWKKKRRAGLWVNSESLTIEAVPNYYAVLSTLPVSEMVPLDQRKAYNMGLDALSFSVKSNDGSTPRQAVPREFQDALIRLKRSAGLFVEKSTDAVDFVGARLFRSRVDLPASAGAGLYLAKFYVIQGGKVTGETSAQIRIQKIGIEAKLSYAALNYPWLYGALAVAIAGAIGGGASLLFRRI
jgi:uncharacterized protein (TIGR02186 family)